MVNLKHRLELLEAIKGSQLNILLRRGDESDEECINRSEYKNSPRINLIIISETDARL